MSAYLTSPRWPVASLAFASLVLFAAACGDDATTPIEPKPKLNLLASGTAVPIAFIHDGSHNVVNNDAIAPTSIHGKAVVNGGGPTPTGTVTFRWYGNVTCDYEPIIVKAGVPLGADGTVDEGTIGIGADRIVGLQVEYSGDANYAGSKSLCAWTNASGKAVPTIETWLHNAGHQVLSEFPALVDLHPIVNVSGSAGTPTGSVSFVRYTGNSCTGTPEYGVQAFVLAFGVADAAADVRSFQPGTYAIQPFYFGDANYAQMLGPCFVFTVVNKAVPTAVVEIHNDAHQVVTSMTAWVYVHGKATVSGSGPTPTGVVGFKRYTNPTCSGDVAGTPEQLDGGGVADGATSLLTMPSGTGSMRAIYSGDANYVATTSPCVQVEFVGGPLASTTMTEAHNNQHQIVTTATISVAVHGKATVTVPGAGPKPTGKVTFRKFENGTCSGTPFVTSFPVELDGSATNDGDDYWTTGGVAGTTYSIQAEYSGDQYYQGSMGSCAVFTRVAGLVPTITTEVHNEAHEPVTTVFPATMTHPKAVVSGAGPAVGGAVKLEHFKNATCTGTPSTTIPFITVIAGVQDAASFQSPAPPVGESWAFRVSYLGDAVYDPGVGPCTLYTTVLQTAGVTLGSVGYWRNWRTHYSSPQLQQLIDYLKTNATSVFNRDQVAGTADDLTAAKIDAIYEFPKKLTATQQVLAHFTSLSLDLALTQIAQQAGLAQPNGAICSAGTLDVSGISGAATLLGTSSPTIAQVTAFVAGKWNGTLTTNRAMWSFDLTSSQLNTLLVVLSRINDGSIVITTGC
jgi:hypothetical protein